MGLKQIAAAIFFDLPLDALEKLSDEEVLEEVAGALTKSRKALEMNAATPVRRSSLYRAYAGIHHNLGPHVDAHLLRATVSSEATSSWIKQFQADWATALEKAAEIEAARINREKMEKALKDQKQRQYEQEIAKTRSLLAFEPLPIPRRRITVRTTYYTMGRESWPVSDRLSLIVAVGTSTVTLADGTELPIAEIGRDYPNNELRFHTLEEVR